MSKNSRITYDELYWQYRGYVVLILKQFMYKGYDESARVLSFILGYKLYESHDGLAAAGPDKDKIMRYLKAYNVNYVILEYGKISEICSFPDNQFNRYLSMAQCLPVSDYDYDNEYELDKPEKEQKSISDQEQSRVICCPAWLVPGLAVAHKYFGVGEVKTVDEDQFVLFTVSFGKKGDRRFQFPEAFAKGYLYIPQK